MGVTAVDDCGGPLAQADFCGSWVEIFGVDDVESLLILKRKNGRVKDSSHMRIKRSWDGRVVE